MVSSYQFPKNKELGKASLSFGTDGIRGHFGRELTPDLAMQAGFWFGKLMPREGPIIIGRDPRESGRILSDALTTGINSAGSEVWDLGLCPTPAIPFLIKKLNAAGGIMVSASHNPPKDNGIKFFGKTGEKLNKKDQKVIETGINSDLSIDSTSNLKSHSAKYCPRNDLLSHYKESLLCSIQCKRLDGIPIVLDLCWGSATACSSDIFQELGAELTIVHGEANGSRINVDCGSTNLEPLKAAVIEKGAMMGFAFDGDADRVLAVDEKGRVLDGDHVLYLWGSDLLNENALPEGKLVATIMSNLGFEKAWLAKGGILTRTPVGDTHVHEEMMKSNTALGGEQSGHILSASNGLIGDGLLTALQLATRCNAPQRTMFEWRNQSFKPFPQKLVNVQVNNQERRNAWSQCQPLQEAVFDAEKSMGEEGRVVLRASGTEPFLRVMVESADPNAVESWASQIANLAYRYLNAA